MAPVEAASLSDLNLLAANPPLYPYNPADEPRAPLTLYLSRVPGTKDIILSPLKPHGKNVTVADVASALYYVHLDGPADEAVAAEVAAAAGPAPARDARIARKPLSPTAAPAPVAALPARKPVPAPAAAEPEAPPTPPRPTFRTLLSRDRAVAATEAPTITTTTTTTATATTHTPIPRKPLGPRGPGGGQADEGNHDHDHDYNDDDHPPPLPRRDPARVPVETLPPVAAPHPLPPLPPRPSLSSPPMAAPTEVPFRLTLIRRDPASDHQWNIGKIASAQAGGPAGAAASHHHPAIHIRIDTSGYAKFRGRPSREAVAAVAQALSPAALKQTVAAAAGVSSKEEEAGGGVSCADMAAAASAWATRDTAAGFSRDLVMAYRRPRWTTGLRNALRRGVEQAAAAHGRARSESGSGSGVGGRGASPWRRHRHAGSTASVVSTDGGGEVQFPAAEAAPTPVPDRRPQGYVFLSPWDSPCAFRTSRSGHRLTCRHALQPGAAAGRPSLRAVMTGTARVSELRFDLPGGRAGAMDDDDDDNDDDDDDDTSSDDDDDDGPFHQIGREAAGGGSRGTRAKLGKLLVFDDGFKMLDLVVAANMGVWWVAWEQGF